MLHIIMYKQQQWQNFNQKTKIDIIYQIIMKFYFLAKTILQYLPNINKNLTSSSLPKLPQIQIIQQLCTTKEFQRKVENHIIKPSNKQEITNGMLIRKLSSIFYGYFGVLVAFSLLTMLSFVAQPFINNFIKQLISHKFDTNLTVIFVQIISIFLTYKIITSLLFVISDCLFMILGVKVYSTMVKQLIQFQHKKDIDCNLIACIEDDCQRLINLPYSSFNSIVKIIEFIILSSLLISKLPDNRIVVSAAYWFFLVISGIMAGYTSKLNLKIMSCKEKRINLINSSDYILKERENQLKNIKLLMLMDGVGHILPWILDIGLMVIVYGIVDMDNSQRYFVLIIFGLVKASIPGLGLNFNLFAQAWSGLGRISNYLNSFNHQTNIAKNQLLNSSDEQIHIPKNIKVFNTKYINEDKQANLTDTLKIAQKSTPQIYLWLILVIFLVTGSNFMYSFCAKSIISGQSIFSLFNMSSLFLQLFSTIVLYVFVCKCNINMSKSVYENLIANKNNYLSELTSEDINRLSGDIRLLDRNLYFSVFSSISHFANIFASFLYSAVTLRNIIFSFLFILVVTCLSVWLIWIFSKFMTLRKECYRKQATNKGMMLQKLSKYQNYTSKWRKIYSYKYFGYAIQITFISLFYAVTTILCTVAISAVLITKVPADSAAVLIMLISQLDSQFLGLLIQFIILQLITTAISRCFSLLKNNNKNCLY